MSHSLLNVALQSLVLGALGWAVVRWGLKDARLRACTALGAVVLACAAPWLLPWMPELPRREIKEVVAIQTAVRYEQRVEEVGLHQVLEKVEETPKKVRWWRKVDWETGIGFFKWLWLVGVLFGVEVGADVLA
jgi:uncharacterized protein involved in high-affinity Fe2+ transport